MIQNRWENLRVVDFVPFIPKYGIIGTRSSCQEVFGKFPEN